MRFLVVTLPKHPAPPEMSLELIKAMDHWLEHYAEYFEQVWGFAGTQGGGGILKVESLEELDKVMRAFPFLQLSKVYVHPLTDLKASLKRSTELLEARVKAKAGGYEPKPCPNCGALI